MGDYPNGPRRIPRGSPHGPRRPPHPQSRQGPQDITNSPTSRERAESDKKKKLRFDDYIKVRTFWDDHRQENSPSRQPPPFYPPYGEPEYDYPNPQDEYDDRHFPPFIPPRPRFGPSWDGSGPVDNRFNPSFLDFWGEPEFQRPIPARMQRGRPELRNELSRFRSHSADQVFNRRAPPEWNAPPLRPINRPIGYFGSPSSSPYYPDPMSSYVRPVVNSEIIPNMASALSSLEDVTNSYAPAYASHPTYVSSPSYTPSAATSSALASANPPNYSNYPQLNASSSLYNYDTEPFNAPPPPSRRLALPAPPGYNDNNLSLLDTSATTYTTPSSNYTPTTAPTTGSPSLNRYSPAVAPNALSTPLPSTPTIQKHRPYPAVHSPHYSVAGPSNFGYPEPVPAIPPMSPAYHVGSQWQMDQGYPTMTIPSLGNEWILQGSGVAF